MARPLRKRAAAYVLDVQADGLKARQELLPPQPVLLFLLTGLPKQFLFLSMKLLELCLVVLLL